MSQVIDYRTQNVGMDPVAANETLDSAAWDAFWKQARHMLDNMVDYSENIRERPVMYPPCPCSFEVK